MVKWLGVAFIEVRVLSDKGGYFDALFGFV